MDQFDLRRLMTAIIYAGLCPELRNIQDETMREIRAKQLRNEAQSTASQLYYGK